MNKSICILGGALCGVLSLQAGEKTLVHEPVQLNRPMQAEFGLGDRLYLSMGFGMMASNGNEHFANGEEWIPSNLYGIQLNLSGEIFRKDRHAQRIGLQSGYFYDTYKSAEWYNLESFDETDELYRLKTRVSVVPVLATYDYVYGLDKHFIIRGGLRTGVLIRTTEAKGEAEQLYGESRFDANSTKVKPVIGAGIGAEVQVSDTSFMYIGFDFLQTFGSDCGPLYSVNGNAELMNTRTKDRYYVTVSAGLVYTF